MMNNVNYLRQLGAFSVTIKQVEKKDAKNFKGKDYPAKLAVVFEDDQGRLIDGNYRLPASEYAWDEKQLKELRRVCGVEKVSELKGKKLVILVAPNFWEGKVFWKVIGAYEAKYLLGEDAALDAALDDVPRAKDPVDELDF